MDHVSDSFLETNRPVLMLIEAAQSGNGREVADCSTMFISHAEKLQKVYMSFVLVCPSVNMKVFKPLGW